MTLSEWASAFSKASDECKAIQAMGRFFTCTYLLDMETERVIVEMIDGKVYRVNISPGAFDAYDFALRASAATWREFAKPVPAPMYHGIWAASFRKDLRIEGNTLSLFQNLRNFTCQFELLRSVGVPV